MEPLGTPIGLGISMNIFNDTYLANGALTSLQRTAFTSGLTGLYFRTVAWRIWLGVYPKEITPEWVSVIKRTREKYQNLMNIYFDGDTPKVIEDPSPEFKDIHRRITNDVDRLFNMYDYFTDSEFRKKMWKMLFIYAYEHQSMNYQQGFHELLAIIYRAIDADLSEQVHIQWKSVSTFPEEYKGVVQCLIDRYYMEHDAYVLFEALMNELGDVYEVKKEVDKRKASNIQEKCDTLFNSLEKIDCMYYQLLVNQNVIPSVFGIRWIKMVFTREFHINDVVEVWDAIFAYGEHLKLIEGMFLAMLIYLRNDVFERDDENYTLKRLMKFPPVFSLRPIIEMAISISDKKDKVGELLHEKVQEVNPVKTNRMKRKEVKKCLVRHTEEVITGSPEQSHIQRDEKSKGRPTNEKKVLPKPEWMNFELL
ncbi:hypothetical protein EIN_066110 [Entamoeba invadens IP1]|uniref:Rab-GAP TBC domain-containing protein n=1 Tax=Entamoeba invadens IP1 TaxID=370355 RepID=A0A0A1TVE9_ENTIV|nr:hypothetical protein EIN_066110 [Entamoeba invadens IP1]ELP84326.1 hypothetical protein EIN_066110 [Entamoeba invadens IP1]|eukprot:XP_004183672.1 hypothetical protein EIN_066110 [Entamoeba invadens IP1]